MTDSGLLRHAEEELSLALVGLERFAGPINHSEDDPHRGAFERLAILHAEIVAHNAEEDVYIAALAAQSEKDEAAREAQERQWREGMNR